MGEPRERPLFVSEFVLAHRGTSPTEWQKYITGEWVQFCGLTARPDELHYEPCTTTGAPSNKIAGSGRRPRGIC